MSSSASKAAVLTVGAVLALGACGGGDRVAETSTVPADAIVLPDASGPSEPAAGTVTIADLEVEDQAGNGRDVSVTSVLLDRGPAWLVITDLGGNVLGVDKVSPRTQPVTMELQPAVTVSQELVASLHLDDGDGEFNADKDPVMVDDEGEPISEDFDYVVQ